MAPRIGGERVIAWWYVTAQGRRERVLDATQEIVVVCRDTASI